jgi:hypothetical protein
MVTPTVIQVLMGVKNCSDFREYNIRCRLNLYTAMIGNIRLSWPLDYTLIFAKGITIRKSTDCLIAQVAIQNDVLLVR